MNATGNAVAPPRRSPRPKKSSFFSASVSVVDDKENTMPAPTSLLVKVPLIQQKKRLRESTSDRSTTSTPLVPDAIDPFDFCGTPSTSSKKAKKMVIPSAVNVATMHPPAVLTNAPLDVSLSKQHPSNVFERTFAEASEILNSSSLSASISFLNCDHRGVILDSSARNDSLASSTPQQKAGPRPPLPSATFSPTLALTLLDTSTMDGNNDSMCTIACRGQEECEDHHGGGGCATNDDSVREDVDAIIRDIELDLSRGKKETEVCGDDRANDTQDEVEVGRCLPTTLAQGDDLLGEILSPSKFQMQEEQLLNESVNSQMLNDSINSTLDDMQISNEIEVELTNSRSFTEDARLLEGGGAGKEPVGNEKDREEAKGSNAIAYDEAQDAAMKIEGAVVSMNVMSCGEEGQETLSVNASACNDSYRASEGDTVGDSEMKYTESIVTAAVEEEEEAAVTSTEEGGKEEEVSVSSDDSRNMSNERKDTVSDMPLNIKFAQILTAVSVSPTTVSSAMSPSAWTSAAQASPLQYPSPQVVKMLTRSPSGVLSKVVPSSSSSSPVPAAELAISPVVMTGPLAVTFLNTVVPNTPIRSFTAAASPRKEPTMDGDTSVASFVTSTAQLPLSPPSSLLLSSSAAVTSSSLSLLVSSSPSSSSSSSSPVAAASSLGYTEADATAQEAAIDAADDTMFTRSILPQSFTAAAAREKKLVQFTLSAISRKAQPRFRNAYLNSEYTRHDDQVVLIDDPIPTEEEKRLMEEEEKKKQEEKERKEKKKMERKRKTLLELQEFYMDTQSDQVSGFLHVKDIDLSPKKGRHNTRRRGQVGKEPAMMSSSASSALSSASVAAPSPSVPTAAFSSSLPTLSTSPPPSVMQMPVSAASASVPLPVTSPAPIRRTIVLKTKSIPSPRSPHTGLKASVVLATPPPVQSIVVAQGSGQRGGRLTKKQQQLQLQLEQQVEHQQLEKLQGCHVPVSTFVETPSATLDEASVLVRASTPLENSDESNAGVIGAIDAATTALVELLKVHMTTFAVSKEQLAKQLGVALSALTE